MALQRNPEELRVVAADLAYLRDTWNALDVDDDTLRRGSGTLRLLVVDGGGGGAYNRAWRSSGLAGGPKVEAVDLKARVTGLELAKVRWAQAGGATHGSGAMMAPFVYNGVMSPEGVQARFEAANRGGLKREMPLAKFLDAPAVIAEGRYVGRRAVIKYVANKLGGVHMETNRNDNDSLLERGSSMKFLDKPAAYFELLSIGQTLVNSDDAATFIAHVGL